VSPSASTPPSEPAPRPLIELEEVDVVLGAERVLRGVSLQVWPGTIHALVGPNGGGKTTLIRTLLGQVRAEGRLYFHFRGSGRVGYVPQRLNLDANLPMTVFDFLCLGLQRRALFLGQRRPKRERCRRILEKLGVAGLGERQLGRLSGGERRRVLLAQALIPDPELLLLDEPSSGVDRLARQSMAEVLAGYRDGGGTVLLVTHDLDQVQSLADRVTVLQRRVQAEGTPGEALNPERLLDSFRSALAGDA